MSTVAHFSLEHYEHMVNVGAFSGAFEKRLELLRGEIIQLSPIGSQHAEFVNRLDEWSGTVATKHRMRVRVQSPIRIAVNDSEPEPDLVWAVQGNYSDRHPEPHELMLLIEVSDSSLEVDRGVKLGIYAEAGIAEYWIVNLLDEQIEVHRRPSGNSYVENAIHRGEVAIHPLALPDASLLPAKLFEA